MEATVMIKYNGKPTTAISEVPLGPELGSKAVAEGYFKYPSVIGMLSYLTNSCSEVAFVVKESTRYTHSYWAGHEGAVQGFCRYLQDTKDQGLIIKCQIPAM